MQPTSAGRRNLLWNIWIHVQATKAITILTYPVTATKTTLTSSTANTLAGCVCLVPTYWDQPPKATEVMVENLLRNTWIASSSLQSSSQ